MDALEATPALTAASRFVMWTICFATAIVAVHYARRTSGQYVPALPLYGMAMVVGGIALHQLYYWLWWRSIALDHADLYQALGQIRHITTITIAVVVVGAVFVMAPFLRQRVGQYWPGGAIAVLVGLWLVGWGDSLKW